MAVGDDSVKTNLVKVWRLELQHLVDASTVDGVCSILDLLCSTFGTAEAGGNELLAELVEQVESGEVSTGGDLDELCESVSDLSLWEGAQKGEVEKGVDGCVVGTEAVLVVAIVDTDFDGDRGVDQANDGSGNADEVGVATVSSAGKSTTRC